MLVDAGDAGTFVSRGPYPAPHPDPLQVRTQGGSVLRYARLVPVFWPDDASEGDLTQMVNDFAKSTTLAAQTAEYGGVGAFVEPAAHPTNLFPPAILTDALGDWLSAELDRPNSSLPAPDDRTLYLLYMPLGINVAYVGGVAEGCQDFDGYHENITLHGHDIAYAVFPRCYEYSGKPLLDELTGATSHEIVEAITDPFPDTAPAYSFVDPLDAYWPILVGGSEIADICTFVPDSFDTDPGVPYLTQRTWSNAAALAGHDPCIPAPRGPYFASAPVLPDIASYDDGFGSTLKTKAVKIPVGGSRTIPLKLFSDGPTDGPWTLSAADDTSVHGAATTLGFVFDPPTGGNGDTVQMTITVLQAPQSMTEGFWVYSTLGTRSSVWLGMVVNQ